MRPGRGCYELLGQLSLSFIGFPFFSFHQPDFGFVALRTSLVLAFSGLAPHGIQQAGHDEAAPERNFGFPGTFGECLAFSHIIACRTDDFHFRSFFAQKIIASYKTLYPYWQPF
jgi:hypothetical protein